MRRQFTGGKLLVASHNQGKVREIRELLSPFVSEVVSANELNLAEPDETEATFEGNAKLKALAAAQSSGLPALADDSGLCVSALDDAPGIYSARWAGPEKNFAAAMQRLRDELNARQALDTSAHFVCVLALAWPDAHAEMFRGEVRGNLIWPPRGARGFGYDPIFVANGHTQTFGEMDPSDKHKISHRARAFAALVQACFQGGAV
jgi:XTP/dITP diphosphohydrolase